MRGPRPVRWPDSDAAALRPMAASGAFGETRVPRRRRMHPDTAMHDATSLPDRPPPCCTEAEVESLVHGFYASVRADALLGPVFDAHVQDWPAHLARLVDFWSSLLRGTQRYSGSPMSLHMAMPGLDEALFRRWLLLFGQATAALGNPAMQQLANARATQIANRFWQRYQVEGRDGSGLIPSPLSAMG